MKREEKENSLIFYEENLRRGGKKIKRGMSDGEIKKNYFIFVFFFSSY